MAQSVEHHLGKVEVPGSNPGNSSKIDDRRHRACTNGGEVIFGGVSKRSV